MAEHSIQRASPSTVGLSRQERSPTIGAVGETMNDQSESIRRPEPGVPEVNGRASQMARGSGRRHVGVTEMFERNAPGHADDRPVWSLSLNPRTPGSPDDRNNEFMTIFSHELRNSLGAVRSAADILRMEIFPSPAAVKARLLIERQVGQMACLVEDLLDISRAQRGKLRLQVERIDLRAVVAHAAQTVEFIMQQQQHQMTTSFPDAPVWLHADPTRLEQVFVNLLLNAAKYTDAGGHVRLSVEQNAGEAVVCICDTGIGIPAASLPHVFDLFVQANPSSRRAEAGLGLGLALVRSLVECQGGRVTAASAGVGQGSEFVVRLPA